MELRKKSWRILIMKCMYIIQILIISFFLLTGCSPDTAIDDTEADIETENIGNSINYSKDKTANTFIAKYNELNPDNIITEDMVSCEDYGGIYITIIKFEHTYFHISESDGSPSFSFESVIEYNDDNTELFFKEAFYVIQAVEENMTNDDIERLFITLQDGEYPFYVYVHSTTTSPGFSFMAPGDKRTIDNVKQELTYQIYWNHVMY